MTFKESNFFASSRVKFSSFRYLLFKQAVQLSFTKLHVWQGVSHSIKYKILNENKKKPSQILVVPLRKYPSSQVATHLPLRPSAGCSI